MFHIHFDRERIIDIPNRAEVSRHPGSTYWFDPEHLQKRVFKKRIELGKISTIYCLVLVNEELLNGNFCQFQFDLFTLNISNMIQRRTNKELFFNAMVHQISNRTNCSFAAYVSLVMKKN